MRKALFLAAVAAVFTALGGTAGANHIAIAGTFGTPESAGSNRVNFVHIEKESSFCCSGAPSFDMGDQGYVSLNAVWINQDTPAGTYEGSGYSPELGYFTVPYTVEHVGEPPLQEGTALNTKLTFSYTYSAPGPYTVRWSDCCFGTPQLSQQIPQEIRTALGPAWAPVQQVLDNDTQPGVDDLWQNTISPVVAQAQEHQPFGMSAGTTHVIAL